MTSTPLPDPSTGRAPVAPDEAATPRARWGLAALAAGAGAIHLAMAVPHVAESVPLGVGFAASGLVQVGLALALVVHPVRRTLAVTAVANVAFLAVWVLSRTAGLPVGEEPWVPEAVGFVDLVCAGFEAVVAAAALLALGAGEAHGGDAGARSAAQHHGAAWRLVGAAVVPVAVLGLTAAALASPSATAHGHDHDAGTAAGADHDHGSMAHDHGDDATAHDHGDGSATDAASADPTSASGDGHDHEAMDHDHGTSGVGDALAAGGAAVSGDGHEAHDHADDGITHLGGDGHQHADCTAPVTPEQQAAADDLVARTDAAIARYQSFDQAVADGYVPITPPSAPIVHYGSFANMTDGRILDPDHVESLMYGFDRQHHPHLLGAMYLNDTPEVTPPTPGGCLTQWHDHTNLCIAPGKGMVGVVKPDGSCPAGSANEVTSQMVHVWTIPLADGPLAHEASPREVRAAVVQQQLGR